MGLPNVTFIKAQGGLGRPLLGEDHISGFVFYDNNLPSGFSSSDRIKQIFQIQDAEALGIVDTYADETRATASYNVTGAGATGDTVAIKVLEPRGYVTIGTYTRSSTDTTPTLVAAGIAAVINSGTSLHGYVASASGGVITLIARPGLGIFINANNPIVITIVGTISGAITQFAGGVASKLAIYHYHISEYFRLQPKGNLFVGVFAVPGTYTFSELQVIQDFSGGKLRLAGIYVPLKAYSAADLTIIQGVQNSLESLYKPLSVFYAADFTGVTDLSTVQDMRGLNAPKVSGVISQDGAALGASLYAAYGKSITDIGAKLGAASFVAVSESIGWVGKVNMSDGVELDVPAFANGVLVKNVSDGLQGVLNDRGYVFLRKFIGNNGTFNNDSNTSVAINSDYAYIENNRVIDKALRNLYASLLPLLNSPLELNSNGTLSDITILVFTNASENGITQMVRDGDLSDFKVAIDSTQNVLSTSKIKISVMLLPKGVAREINVTLGYTLKIAA
jgi:hypothetical protein